ncbi:MAG TPA: exodeoxyribonuclease VII small subunit [Acidimicrobiales bacterium]|nr:exodeoxyribonuclease VII small subunit [Acidimicrobiales bacterium]
MTEDLTYEQIVERLEAVTAELASGTAGIEAAADLFEQAKQLHAAASARLEQVRQRLEALAPSDEA